MTQSGGSAVRSELAVAAEARRGRDSAACADDDDASHSLSATAAVGVRISTREPEVFPRSAFRRLRLDDHDRLEVQPREGPERVPGHRPAIGAGGGCTGRGCTMCSCGRDTRSEWPILSR